jgi:uncharacterized phage protein (TIGR02218 family)
MATAYRTIPAGLQAHLDSGATTLAYLLKITAKDGTSFGVTSSDQDLTFDDGAGPLNYSAAIGLDASALATTGALDVDNLEAKMLVVDASPFTENAIRAGALDFARFYIYRVNARDLAAGSWIVLSGTTGAVRAMDGLAGVVELRGLSQTLKQTVGGGLYSTTCRARFGSLDGDQTQPCMFDASTLWSSDTILGVDVDEPDRIFTATTTPAATGPLGPVPSFVPGLVKFTSGDNAGLTTEIEDVSGDLITLRFQTPSPIQVGDGYQIRPDCRKRYLEDCVGIWDNGIWFRGEPFLTVTDQAAQMMPGAIWPIVAYSGPSFEIP